MNKYVFVIILILLLYPILTYNNYEGMSGDTDTTPSNSEKINLPLKDSGESLFNRIKKAYEDSSSNGVFLSIILQLPGNGNILLMVPVQLYVKIYIKQHMEALVI